MGNEVASADQTEALLAQARAGNADAFGLLFAAHQDFLRRVIAVRLDRRMRGRFDPSDVLQETRLEAFQRLEEFCRRRPMALRVWLRETACQRLARLGRFHVHASRRTVTREAALPDESACQLVHTLHARGSSPSQHLRRGELRRQVREMLGRLAPIDREILVLRNLESMTNAEAAQALSIDPAAASQRYGRALLRLRRELLDSGLAGSSA